MNDDDGVSNFQHNLIIRLFKMLDFGYSNVVYFTMATCIMALINRLFFGNVISEHQERKKKTAQLGVEVILNAWLSGVSLYFARHVFEFIHFPLQGLYGYDHSKVHEVMGGAPFSVFLNSFDTRFRLQILILSERFGFSVQS